MGHSEFDPATRERRPWNAGRMVGAKRALKPQQVGVQTRKCILGGHAEAWGASCRGRLADLTLIVVGEARVPTLEQ
jgi:hypothetical protein